MRHPLAWALTLALLPHPDAAAQTAATPVPVSARLQTAPAGSGEASTATLVLDAREPARSRVVATAGLGGLEVYSLQGKKVGGASGGELASVDVSYGVMLDGRDTTVLAAVDATDNRLRLYAMRGDVPTEISARTIALGFAVEGVCLYRHRLDGNLYAFVVGDGGEIDQHILFPADGGRLDARQVRRISVPSPLKQCSASADGHLYASEEAVGLWRFNADPEADTGAVLVDSPLLGRLDEEIGGVATFDGGDGARWLLASDASGGHVNVYDRGDRDAYLGSFAVLAPGASEAIGEPGPLFATSMALGSRFPQGLLLVADEDAANYKLVSFADIASALSLRQGNPQDPRRVAQPPLPTVTATVETVPVSSYGDAADDPAVWALPTNPAQSLVVATDKKGGLYLYDMQGKVVQFLPVGKVNNVDLREGFALGGEQTVLVTATNRTDDSISIFRLDTRARRLVDVADGTQPTGMDDPYGLCMYRQPGSGRTFVFVNGDDTRKRQWELVDAGNGRVRANPVRNMAFDSQTEGCVVDDASGMLLVNEEDVAMWRMSASPDGGNDRTAVQRIADNPAVKDDLEGVGIYHLGNGRGYIVASSQGNDSYAVYRLEGDQAYIGSFAVVADPVLGIDGISETDGLEVTSANLGPGFEHGAMIAQDGRNVMPTENQNYKYVPWQSIARALKLEMRED
jgi:3-phytase